MANVRETAMIAADPSEVWEIAGDPGYPGPSLAAARIKDHVAFWHGVRVIPVPDAGERSVGS